jgi:hypothetical protein
MKKIKKLSREELKTVKGATGIDGPVYIYCGRNRKWCEKGKICISATANCDDFEIPVEDGGW